MHDYIYSKEDCAEVCKDYVPGGPLHQAQAEKTRSRQALSPDGIAPAAE